MKNREVKNLFPAQAQLGEGPVWDQTRNGLWWVNINAGELHYYGFADNADQVWQFGQAIGCAVPDKSGGLVVGLKSGLARFTPAVPGPAKFEMIAAPEAHLTDNRWNDGKCGPDGRLLSGTMDSTEKTKSGSLYSLSADGSLRVMRHPVGISNGLAWSPDGHTLYYIDTPTRQVLAFDYDLASGEIANERAIIEIPQNSGWPDGMACDGQGRLWIALWAGSAIIVWDPKSGKLVDSVSIPAKNVTSCCFGGPNLDRLFITTARVATNPAELSRWPQSGDLFVLEPGCEGLPTNYFGA